MTTGPSLWEGFQANRIVADCPIYDMHGHWGSTPGIALPAARFDTAKSLLLQSGIARLIICHHHSLFSPDAGNATNVAAVRGLPEVLRAYMGINPNYPEIITRDLAEFDQYPDVYVGFKMLADYHRISIADSPYRPVWEMANDRRLPVLLHTWGSSPYDGYEPVKRVLQRYPNARVLLGHSIFGEWDRAAQLAASFANCYVELTAASLVRGALERMIEGVGSEKIVFGTDFPWFNEPYCIGTILGADITDEDRRNIFYRNARRILGEG